MKAIPVGMILPILRVIIQYDPENIPEDVVAGIGILSLNGEEELFHTRWDNTVL